jgi:hypothetical protein
MAEYGGRRPGGLSSLGLRVVFLDCRQDENAIRMRRELHRTGAEGTRGPLTSPKGHAVAEGVQERERRRRRRLTGLTPVNKNMGRGGGSVGSVTIGHVAVATERHRHLGGEDRSHEQAWPGVM